jgi:dipeptidyl aminopeptidase/acylaminoacyl peptidase
MRWWPAFALGIALCGPNLAAAAPLEAYGRLPSVEDIQISPDGATLAFVLTSGEDRRIVIKRLADHAVLGVLNAGAVKLRDLQWADAQHLLLTTSVTSGARGVVGPREEWRPVNVYDIVQKRQYGLLDKIEDAMGETMPEAMNVVAGGSDIRIIDGRTVVFQQGVNFVNQRSVLALFKTDLATNRSRLVEVGDDKAVDWLVDAQGRTLAEAQYDEPSGKWSLRLRRADGHWLDSRTIVAPIDTPSLAGLARDGTSVLVETTEAGVATLHEVSAVDGAWGPAIPDPYDVLIHDPATHALIGGAELTGDALTYTFFDPKAAASWAKVLRAFPGQQVTLTSWSADQIKVVVDVDSRKEGAAYALVDLTTNQAEWLGEPYPDVPDSDIDEVRAVSYKAADGLVITGYLTLPPGKPDRNLPLVVLPHGGPEARDAPYFDWWAQAVASRGYAVLQPNFRGSAGFGHDFVAAGYGQWGRKMQTDLSDGVRYLAAQGTINPKRVCIFGGSYRGYAALAGATLDPGVYRCALSVAGPADLRRMLRDIQDEQQSKKTEALRYWGRFMGAKGADDPALEAISPAALADKVQIPILLIHGKDDTVVPYVQSQIMADALKRAGKPVTLVTLEGEDHWLSRGDTRLRMLTAAMAFIEANNPAN